jgi:CubicO group peptidase (beta-lactamase class C family)
MFTRARHFLAFLGLPLGLFAQPAAESTKPIPNDHAPSQKFLAHVTELRTAFKIPGLAVVVLRGTTCVLAEGLGEANLADHTPVTPETLFNIASVTKPISAVVALRLVELGQLDLDRPLSAYDGYNDYRTEARAVGGLFFRDFDDDPKKPLTLRQLLSMQANGTPGTRFFYNPPAYSWASRPLAQAGKAPFSELTTRYVFNPAEEAKRGHV